MPATLADIQKKYGESVYPLYKDQMHEPYMENDNGIGYKGVVMYDEHEDKVQCHICGKWFQFLPPHIAKFHKVTAKKYRDDGGINNTAALCSVNYSKQRSELAKSNAYNSISTQFKKGVPNHNYRAVKPKPKMMYKNKFGLCDAQIAARLVIVRDMCGKEDLADVISTDIEKYDRPLLAAICRKYGNYENASKALGLLYLGKNSSGGKYGFKKVFNDSMLISGLRHFVIENERIPFARDLSPKKGMGLPSQQVYIDNFGSWRRAKMMAGLDQLLAEVKGE